MPNCADIDQPGLRLVVEVALEGVHELTVIVVSGQLELLEEQRLLEDPQSRLREQPEDVSEQVRVLGGGCRRTDATRLNEELFDLPPKRPCDGLSVLNVKSRTKSRNSVARFPERSARNASHGWSAVRSGLSQLDRHARSASSAACP